MEALDNSDFKGMTKVQLAIHLFLLQAYPTMAKQVIEFLQLEKKDQCMADFRKTLKPTENSPWYAGAQK